MLAVLLAALLLPTPDGRAQNSAPGQTTPKKVVRGGGRRAQSDEGDITNDIKPLSCPKGFRAVKTSGPHLTPTRSASASSALGRKKSQREAHATAATAFGRRCVPVTAGKSASPATTASAAPAAKEPPRTSDP